MQIIGRHTQIATMIRIISILFLTFCIVKSEVSMSDLCLPIVYNNVNLTCCSTEKCWSIDSVIELTDVNIDEKQLYREMHKDAYHSSCVKLTTNHPAVENDDHILCVSRTRVWTLNYAGEGDSTKKCQGPCWSNKRDILMIKKITKS